MSSKVAFLIVFTIVGNIDVRIRTLNSFTGKRTPRFRERWEIQRNKLGAKKRLKRTDNQALYQQIQRFYNLDSIAVGCNEQVKASPTNPQLCGSWKNQLLCCVFLVGFSTFFIITFLYNNMWIALLTRYLASVEDYQPDARPMPFTNNQACSLLNYKCQILKAWRAWTILQNALRNNLFKENNKCLSALTPYKPWTSTIENSTDRIVKAPQIVCSSILAKEVSYKQIGSTYFFRALHRRTIASSQIV